MVYLRDEVSEYAKQGATGIKAALQTALRLEHAVIPPYLYALFSLKAGYNFDVIQVFRSIFLEEMSHMALVANVLNALGHTPHVDFPHFILKYPNHLPGAVEHGLLVPLHRFSRKVVRYVFGVIEEPEDATSDMPSRWTTIGQFYRDIREKLRSLPRNEFKGDPDRQLRTGFGPLQTIYVDGPESAAAAITEIVDQGEGEEKSVFDEEGQLGHYYRLVEIYFGRKLVFYPGDPPPRSHAFGDLESLCVGHTIDFDPRGVWPAVDNPRISLYTHNHRLRALNRDFNRTYTRLLKCLQEVFSGNQDRLAVAITLMTSLKEIAQYLMSIEVGPGVTAGPTFEYTA